MAECSNKKRMIKKSNWFKFRKGGDFGGTPGRIRTCDLRIRSPLLYPAELQAHTTQQTGRLITN